MNVLLLSPRLLLGMATTLAATAPAQGWMNRAISDFDQKRATLPNTGLQYCVPTAWADLLRYMAANGMTGVDGGYTNNYGTATTASKYTKATNLIKALGTAMATSATAGTNGYNAYEGMADWLDNYGPYYLVYQNPGVGGYWGTEELRSYLAAGCALRISYGRYTQDASLRWTRNDGHSVALSGYDYTGADRFVYVADPNNGDTSLTTQGPFTYDAQHVLDVAINLAGGGTVSHPQYSDWVGPAGNRRAVMDNLHAIYPYWVAYLVPNVAAVPGKGAAGSNAATPPPSSVVHAAFSNPVDDGKNPPLREAEVELPEVVTDFCADLKGVAVYALGESGMVYRVDLPSKKVDRVALVKGGRKLTVAGKRLDVYVLRDSGRTDGVVRLQPDSGKQTSLTVPKGITSLEPDQRTFGLAALQAGQGLILRIDPDLRTARPQKVALPEGSGKPFLLLDRRGEGTLVREGGRTLVRVGSTAPPIRLARPIKVSEFLPLGKGAFLVQEGDRLLTIDARGREVKGPFDALRVSGPVRVARSWRAFAKADVSGPGWREVPPRRGEP